MSPSSPRRPVAPSLSACDLVIPALDEAPNIEPLFDALAPFMGRDIRHVVLADNGSTDGTAEAAARRGAVVVHETQRGYGAACLRALGWISHRDEPPAMVAFLDADLADDPAELPRLLAPIRAGEADVVIGSRVRHATPGALNPVQRFGNGLACTLMRILGGRRYSDLGPFRVATWNAMQRMDMADRTWGWTVEMQMKAALLGLRVQEIDVPYRPRPGGRSKISGTVRGVVTAGTKIITTIFVLWWRRGAIRNVETSKRRNVEIGVRRSRKVDGR